MTIKKLFDKAWSAAENRSWTRGLLGKPDGSGGHIVAVTDRPGHVFVRVSVAGSESVTIAKNLGKVPNRANLPVRMRLEIGGTYTIYELDPNYAATATAIDTLNPYGLPNHTHATGVPGLTYEIEALRIEMGRVYPIGGWFVTVNPFRYYTGSAWQTYEGEDLTLASNKPTTSGKHRWVVVCVNPATNAAIAVNGSDQNYATTLTLADIDAISIGSYIPLAAVVMRQDDTSVNDISLFHDAKGWLEFASTGLTFNDAEGNSADVTTATPADGTSTYAARRDHAHGIAADAVTFTKMQNIATDRLIGRDTASSGDPEEITVGGGLEFTGSGGVQRSALTGNVTASAGSNTTTIAAGVVTAAMLQDGAALAEILDDDGAGSGLDADLLDGSHAAAFATSGHTHAGTVTGVSLITDWSYRATDRSASAFAWKGNEFTGDVDHILYAIGFYGGLVASATYKAAVVTGTSTPGNVATFTASNSVTLSGTPTATDGGWIWLEFTSPVTLTAGTVYGLMFGRTDGADTYALPVPFNGGTSSINAVPMFGKSHGRSWRIAKANPVAGDTIGLVTTDSVGMGFRFRTVGSLY